jgi:hypothetical protein
VRLRIPLARHPADPDVGEGVAEPSGLITQALKVTLRRPSRIPISSWPWSKNIWVCPASVAETERSQLEVVESRIAEHERALGDLMAEAALRGDLSSRATQAAIVRVEAQLSSLREHRAQIEVWQADVAVKDSRLRLLRKTAGNLYRKFPADDVAAISPEEGKALLQLLDVRVEVLGYGPLRLRISGSVSDSDRAKSGVDRQGLEPCPPLSGLI